MSDSIEFNREVTAAKKLLSLEMVARLSMNDVPECFEFSRGTGVALAQLLMEALRQNQIMALTLKVMRDKVTEAAKLIRP